MGRFGENSSGWWHEVSVSWRPVLIAWEFRRPCYYELRDLSYYDGIAWHNYRLPPDTDLAVHRTFCRGQMPAPVYADWLEDQGVPLPAEIYVALRGW